MSGSLWEPALMLGVLFSLLALAGWHLVGPMLALAWARTWRIRETCAIAFYYLPRMFAEAAFLFVLGQWAWWRRERAAMREFRQAWRARECRGYEKESQL